MKKLGLIVLGIVFSAGLGMAVDLEVVDYAGFSTPSSVRPAMQKIDRNFSALKTVVDAAPAAYQPLDADLTDLADGSLTGSKVGTGVPFASISTGLSTATATVDRVVMTSGTVNARTILQSASTTANYVVDYWPACTNGQVITYMGGALLSEPSVLVSYSTTSTTQTITTNAQIHSKTVSNCVVECEAGLTVDVIVMGPR